MGETHVHEKRSALIVGCSDGIGLALTARLLEEGFVVTGISRSESPLQEPAYTHRVQDVADPAYPAVIEEIARKLGALDLCVYCAGIGEPLDLRNPSMEHRVIEVNLAAAVATLQAVLPAMHRARGGHLIALSSLADSVLDSVAPAYAASKAGLSSYLANLHRLLRPHGIAVTNVRFGFVDTKMARATRRPMMISVERAVDLLMECIERRPAQLTHPRTANLVIQLIRLAQLARLWRPGTRPTLPIRRESHDAS